MTNRCWCTSYPERWPKLSCSLVDRIVRYPNYNQVNTRNGISLYRTDRTSRFVNNVIRAIPLRRRPVDGGVAAVCSGWGVVGVERNGL